MKRLVVFLLTTLGVLILTFTYSIADDSPLDHKPQETKTGEAEYRYAGYQLLFMKTTKGMSVDTLKSSCALDYMELDGANGYAIGNNYDSEPVSVSWLESGNAYLIKVKDTTGNDSGKCDVPWEGELLERGKIELHSGSQFVGANGDVSKSQISASCSNPSLFNIDDGDYLKVDKMKAGKGYMLRVDGSCEIDLGVAQLNVSPSVHWSNDDLQTFYFGRIGRSLTFDASDSYDPDGAIKEFTFGFDRLDKGSGGYAWSPWDGDSSITHTFHNPAFYSTKVKIKDQDGVKGSKTVGLMIGEEAKFIGQIEKNEYGYKIINPSEWLTAKPESPSYCDFSSINHIHDLTKDKRIPEVTSSFSVGDWVKVSTFLGPWCDGFFTKSTHYLKEVPDLTVEKLTWKPANPKVGEKVTFKATISNSGSSSVTTEFGYRLDGGRYNREGEIEVPANSSTKVEFSHTFSSSGDHTVEFIVDRSDEIQESNEDNNTISKSISVEKSLPDIKVVDVRVDPNPAILGEEATLVIEIKNVGSVEVPEAKYQFGLSFYDVYNEKGDCLWASLKEKDHLIATKDLTTTTSIGPLEPGQSTTILLDFDVSVDLTKSVSMSFASRIKVNGGPSKVSESSYENNKHTYSEFQSKLGAEAFISCIKGVVTAATGNTVAASIIEAGLNPDEVSEEVILQYSKHIKLAIENIQKPDWAATASNIVDAGLAIGELIDKSGMIEKVTFVKDYLKILIIGGGDCGATITDFALPLVQEAIREGVIEDWFEAIEGGLIGVWEVVEGGLLDAGSIIGLHSPADIVVVDSQGRKTGYRNDNKLTEIPGSKVSVKDHAVYLKLPEGVKDYEVVTTGTGTGSVTLELGSITGGSLKGFQYKDISVDEGTSLKVESPAQNPDGTMKVDQDGDGTYESQVKPDQEVETIPSLSFEDGTVGSNKPPTPWYIKDGAGIHEVSNKYSSDGDKSMHTASYRDDLKETNVAIKVDLSRVAKIVYDVYLQAGEPDWGDVKLKVDNSKNTISGVTSNKEDQWYYDQIGDVSGFSGIHTLYLHVRGDGNDAFWDNFRFLNSEDKPIDPSEILVSSEKRTHQLYPGWNLFSPPGSPVNPSPKSALGDDIKGLRLHYGYSPGKGYKTYPDETKKTQLTWREGYWLSLDNKTPVAMAARGVSGDRRLEFTREGWHMIGVPYEANWSQTDFSDPADFETDGAGHIRVVSWDPTNGKYLNHYSGDSYVLGKWRGFWIKVKEASTTDPAWLKVSKTSEAPPPLSAQTPLPESVDRSELDYPPLLQKIADNLKAFAYPNPVIEKDKVTFATKMADVEKLKVTVTNPAGRVIYDSGYEAGNKLTWNLENGSGNKVANGIYLYKIQASGNNGSIQTSGVKKLLVLQ